MSLMECNGCGIGGGVHIAGGGMFNSGTDTNSSFLEDFCVSLMECNGGGIGGGVHIAGGGMFDSGAVTNSSFLGDL